MWKHILHARISPAKRFISVLLSIALLWMQIGSAYAEMATGSMLKTWYLFEKGFYNSGVNALDGTMTQSIGDLVDYTYYIGTDGNRVKLTQYEYDPGKSKISKITDCTTGQYIEYGRIIADDGTVKGWGAVLEKDATGAIIGAYNYNNMGQLVSKDIYGMTAEEEAAFQTENEQIAAEIEALTGQQATLQSQLETQQTELEALQSSLQTIEARITTLTTTITSLQNTRQQYENNLSQLQATLTALQNGGDVALSAADQSYIDQQTALRGQYTATKETLNSQKQALINQKTALETQNSQLSAEITIENNGIAEDQDALDQLGDVTYTMVIEQQVQVIDHYDTITYIDHYNTIDDGCGASHQEAVYASYQQAIYRTDTVSTSSEQTLSADDSASLEAALSLCDSAATTNASGQTVYYTMDTANRSKVTQKKNLNADIATRQAAIAGKNTQISNNTYGTNGITALTNTIASLTSQAAAQDTLITQCSTNITNRLTSVRQARISATNAQISSTRDALYGRNELVFSWGGTFGFSLSIRHTKGIIDNITDTQTELTRNRTAESQYESSIVRKQTVMGSLNGSLSAIGADMETLSDEKAALEDQIAVASGERIVDVSSDDLVNKKGVGPVAPRASNPKAGTASPQTQSTTSGGGTTQVVNDEIEYIQGQIETIDAEITDAEAQLDEALENQTQAEEDIQNKEAQISDTQARIDNITERINTLDARKNRVVTSTIYYKNVMKDGKAQQVLDYQKDFYRFGKEKQNPGASDYDKDEKDHWISQDGLISKIWQYDATNGKLTSAIEFKQEWTTKTGCARSVTIDDVCGASHSETRNDGVESQLQTHMYITTYDEDEKPDAVYMQGSTSRIQVGTFTYDNAGRLSQSTYTDANGMKTTTGFDTLGRAKFSVTEGTQTSMETIEGGYIDPVTGKTTNSPFPTTMHIRTETTYQYNDTKGAVSVNGETVRAGGMISTTSRTRVTGGMAFKVPSFIGTFEAQTNIDNSTVTVNYYKNGKMYETDNLSSYKDPATGKEMVHNDSKTTVSADLFSKIMITAVSSLLAVGMAVVGVILTVPTAGLSDFLIVGAFALVDAMIVSLSALGTKTSNNESLGAPTTDPVANTGYLELSLRPPVEPPKAPITTAPMSPLNTGWGMK